jgi:hypothetical protein
VTPNQLQARAGRVRCGRCMNAFDAYDALAAEAGRILPAPTTEAAAPQPQPIGPGVTAAPAMATTDSKAAAAPFPTPATPPVAADALTPPLMPRMAESPTPAAAAAAGEVAGITPSAGAPVGATGPAVERRRPLAELLTHPTRTQLWLAGAGALALLLVLQAAFAYRSEIVARFPRIRSALTALCEHVGCHVSLPQRPELVRIEASDVHMVDASRPQLIQLTATLRSYAGYDLAYPALDLVLTNANEHALARRIFRPDEYLDATRDPDAGIPANAEITVALDLDTGDLNAAGFRLDLLAAPAP